MRARTEVMVLSGLLAAGCGLFRSERRDDGERAGARGGAPRTEPGGKQAGVKPRPGAPRVPPTPEGLLGTRTVTEVQEALARRGLLGDHRRGELDRPTSAAVKRFQAQRGLAETGMPDRETLRDLGVSAEEAYGTGTTSQGPP